MYTEKRLPICWGDWWAGAHMLPPQADLSGELPHLMNLCFYPLCQGIRYQSTLATHPSDSILSFSDDNPPFSLRSHSATEKGDYDHAWLASQIFQPAQALCSEHSQETYHPTLVSAYGPVSSIRPYQTLAPTSPGSHLVCI